MQGFKAFEADFTCRGFQYEVGKTYELPEGEPAIPCVWGFHFCRSPRACNRYYAEVDHPRYAEILAWDVIHVGDKSVARKIQIVREITDWHGTVISHCLRNRECRVLHLQNGRFHVEGKPTLFLFDREECEWYHQGRLYAVMWRSDRHTYNWYYQSKFVE